MHCPWLHIAGLNSPVCWHWMPFLSCIRSTWLDNNLSLACALAVGASLPVSSWHV